MGNYEYFRKIETNGNLLIFCQTTSMTSNYSRCRNGDIRDREGLSKVNFPANSAI